MPPDDKPDTPPEELHPADIALAFGNIEPPLSKSSAIHQRWRWWFSSIADLLIAYPQLQQKEIAQKLNKTPNYIGAIMATDMFKEYFHQRKIQYRATLDSTLTKKMADVAMEGLDLMLSQLKSKGNQVPLPLLEKITTSTLDRLGFAPQAGPQVVVNNNQDNRQQTVAVSVQDLEEARNAMRRIEASKSGTSLSPPGDDGGGRARGQELDGLPDPIDDVNVEISTGADPS